MRVCDPDPRPGLVCGGCEWGEAREEVGDWFGELPGVGVAFVGVVERLAGVGVR